MKQKVKKGNRQQQIELTLQTPRVQLFQFRHTGRGLCLSGISLPVDKKQIYEPTDVQRWWIQSRCRNKGYLPTIKRSFLLSNTSNTFSSASAIMEFANGSIPLTHCGIDSTPVLIKSQFGPNNLWLFEDLLYLLDKKLCHSWLWVRSCFHFLTKTMYSHIHL